jgi:hypothetical protein
MFYQSNLKLICFSGVYFQFMKQLRTEDIDECVNMEKLCLNFERNLIPDVTF